MDNKQVEVVAVMLKDMWDSHGGGIIFKEFATAIVAHFEAQHEKELGCDMCGGDGIARCGNPDHNFIDGIGREIGRLGCPVCGHDKDFKIKGEECEGCNGTGKSGYIHKKEIQPLLDNILQHLKDLDSTGDIQINSGMTWDNMIDMHRKTLAKGVK